jgi:hypothetical protein
MQTVGPDNEWCAEAFLEPDYSQLTREDFQGWLREYVINVYNLSHGVMTAGREDPPKEE